MLPYELQLASRDLGRHPWHTLAMVVGLALAVLVMVYIPCTLESFYDDMIDRTIEQNSAHITIWPRERGGQMAVALRETMGQGSVLDLADRTFPRRRDLNGYHALVQQVQQAPGVQAVAAFARGDATISRGNVQLGIAMEGIVGKDYARVIHIAKHFPDGRVPELGPGEIAVGFRLADKLGVRVGEHVHVAVAPRVEVIEDQIAPQNQPPAGTSRLMKVKAIFRSGYYEKDLQHAYVSLATAQRMLQMGNEVSALAVRASQLEQAGDITAALDRRLNHKVRNWMDDNASLLAEVATVKRVALFINVLVALVASAGMANVFSIFVLNRQKELAILRAMGASRLSLRGIILLEALCIWLIGTVLGYTAALGVMAYEQGHPFEVSAETYGIGAYSTVPKLVPFITAGALAAATMIFSAWWSGKKAAKLNPVDVIFGK